VGKSLEQLDQNLPCCCSSRGARDVEPSYDGLVFCAAEGSGDPDTLGVAGDAPAAGGVGLRLEAKAGDAVPVAAPEGGGARRFEVWGYEVGGGRGGDRSGLDVVVVGLRVGGLRQRVGVGWLGSG
jgi:hypothetical protein